jgi:hypothetical protein
MAVILQEVTGKQIPRCILSKYFEATFPLIFYPIGDEKKAVLREL